MAEMISASASDAREPAHPYFGLLSDQSHLLVRALESTADSVMISTKDGVILYANPAFAKQTGFALEEVIGQNTFMLRTGRMQPSFYEEMFRVLKLGQVFRGDFISKSRNGDLFTENKTITPIRDGQGEITHYISTGRDATEMQKTLEMEMKLRAAEEAEHLKTNLLGTISHELRTPLAAILSYTSAIREYGEQLGAQRVDEYLHHIEDRSRQLERLISDLLTMSRLESGNLPMQFETAKLEDEIAELAGEWHLRGTLDLQVVVAEPSLLVRIDVIRIREVLQNLLENAEKYAGVNAKVVIAARVSAPNEIEVSVADNGPGVARSELDLIFDRFQRAKTERIGSGAGIGLSICKAIVEAHGGNIRACLPSSGGLAVSFTVPFAPAL